MRRLTALVALGGLSCSLMIAGESAPLHCSEAGRPGPPACDEGQVCRAGICQSEASDGGAGVTVGEAGGVTVGEANANGGLASGGAGGAA